MRKKIYNMQGTNNFQGNEDLPFSDTAFARSASISENWFVVTAAVVGVRINTIRPDNFVLSGLSGIRPDSEIHYPVHPNQ